MGEYVDSTLTSGETVAYEAKHHWMIFFSLYALFTLWIGPLLAWSGDEFAITSKRIVAKAGVIRRTTLEINLEKVESVGVGQSILGRILGYGNVIVNGTGGTSEAFRFISRPLECRKAFQEVQS